MKVTRKLITFCIVFACSSYAQARQAFKQFCKQAEENSELDVWDFKYIPDIFATLNANNETTGGGGDTGNTCDIENPYLEASEPGNDDFEQFNEYDEYDDDEEEFYDE